MPFLTQGKTNWKYILIVVIVAVIVGGGILGYWRWTAREEIRIPEIKLPERRILIDQKRWDEQIDNPINLGEKFNTDPPTAKVLYTDPEKGILLHLPYNPKWGTEKYKILPYYKESCPIREMMEEIYGNIICEDGISFGPPAFYETIYEVPKTYFIKYLNTLVFLPARNSEEIKTSLRYFQKGKGRGVGGGVLEETVVEDTINNILVVRYTYFRSDGVEFPMIEVCGKKYNYLFICDFCGKEEWKITEEVIGSLKFTE
jgi:hypothetical protein